MVVEEEGEFEGGLGLPPGRVEERERGKEGRKEKRKPEHPLPLGKKSLNGGSIKEPGQQVSTI